MDFLLEPQRKFLHNRMCGIKNFSTGSVKKKEASTFQQVIYQHLTGIVDKFLRIETIGVTLLSLNKKVTKEVSIGEALGVELPLANTPSPMYPTRRALAIVRYKVSG